MTGEVLITANERERLAIMGVYGQAIGIIPVISDDGDFEGNGIYCGMCYSESLLPDPVPFMVCNCCKWDCIKDAVREHLTFHVDKLLVIREN